MGVIISQSIRNTIYSYLGILVGTIYTLFLVPEVFTGRSEEWGIIQLFTSYILIFLPFTLLGYPNIIIKFWPRYSKLNREGFIFFLAILCSIGLFLMLILIYTFKGFIFYSKSNNNELISKYLVYFFVFFTIHTIFYFLLYYARVFYKTAFPTFLKDAFIKFWTFALIMLYWLNYIDFGVFLELYFFAYFVQLVVMFFYLNNEGILFLRVNLSFFKDKNSLKEVVRYGFYSLLTGGASILVTRIDILMINKYINLDNVAFYSVALFFITVLQVPVRSIGTIASPIISEFLNNNETYKVKELYQKTALNITLICSFVLSLIILNINEFMMILGNEFGQVKYVIIILGIAKLYEMINSTNSIIIITSNYFRYDLLFQIFLLLLTVSTNIILIPRYGINGAAMATAISLIISTTIKGVFVYKKYKLMPYSIGTIKIALTTLMCLFGVILLPSINNPYLGIVVKGMLISIIYFISTILFNISDDLKKLWFAWLKKVKGYIPT